MQKHQDPDGAKEEASGSSSSTRPPEGGGGRSSDMLQKSWDKMENKISGGEGGLNQCC